MFLRSKSSLIGALGSILTVFLMYHILKLSSTKQYTRYLDSTEITNYTLLESLLLPKDSSSPEIPPDNIYLSLNELKSLASTQNIEAVTTTVIIQYESIDSLALQLESISNQINVISPKTVHIVCINNQQKSTAENYIQRNGLQYQVSINTDDIWYHHITTIDTEFVIIMERQVVPGQGYFQFILSLLATPQFKNKLIGTEQRNVNICQQNEAHYVTSLTDIHILRREWYLQADLPSVILPTSIVDHDLHGNIKSNCVNIPSGGVLFYKEDSDALDELICQFAKKDGLVMHIVSKKELPVCHFISDDVVMIQHSVVGEQELHRLIEKTSPHVIFHEESSNISKTQEFVWIGLPTNQVAMVTSWITNLSIEALAKWHTPQINLIVATGGKRYKEVKKLFNNIKNAHYLGDQVHLSIVMDETSNEKVLQNVNDLNWKHGAVYLRHRISGAHPMQIFTEAWYPSSNDEYGVMMDDRIELSSAYYIWLKYNILKYRHESKQQQIFGISLYSPRILDTDPSGRQLMTNMQSPYLMQVPCTFGGALYFPEHWREFHDYITARLTDQAIVKRGSGKQHLFKDSLLIVSKSNKWLNSWRKYFDEVAYMRGYVMIYPSESYSTLKSITEVKNSKKKELYIAAEKLYQVSFTDEIRELPDVELLPVLDLLGKPSSMESILKKGHDLQHKFSACEPVLDHHHDPSDLLCPFSQLIQVSIDQTTIPTKTVHILDL